MRETWPLPSLSTDVKLGADMLLLPEPDVPMLPEVPLPVLPLLPLLPEDMPELPEEPLVPELPDEVCAMVALESAKSARAAAVVMTFNMEIPPGGVGMRTFTAPTLMQNECPRGVARAATRL